MEAIRVIGIAMAVAGVLPGMVSASTVTNTTTPFKMNATQLNNHGQVPHISNMTAQQYEFYVTNATTRVWDNSTHDHLGRELPKGMTAKEALSAMTNGTVQKRACSSCDCGACLPYVDYWDFWIAELTMDAYNPVLSGYGPPSEFHTWIVAGENGWGPECITGSSYTENYQFWHDICTGAQYVGQDPWDTSEWMYVSYCDDTDNPSVVWLNYASGQSAAYCVQYPDQWNCDDSGDIQTTWDVSPALQCQHVPQSSWEIMQVNYYSDQWTTDYMGQLTITGGAQGSCLEYYIAGAGSMNIANCYYENQCECVLSTGSWCGSGNNGYIGAEMWGGAWGTNTASLIYEPNWITCWINYPQ